MAIISFYASVLAVFYISLTVNAVRLRRKHGIARGFGNNEELTRAVRAHGNFSEYTPFALVLFFLAERNEAPVWFMHAVCLLLVIGRLTHAYGILVMENPENETTSLKGRIAGMAMTLSAIGLSALFLFASSAISFMGF